MDEFPWADVARKAWHAVSTGDAEELATVLAEDAVWYASGRGPRSGEFHGRAAIIDYLGGIGEAAEQFDSELEDVLEGHGHTAMLFRVDGRRKGRSLSTGFVLLLTIADQRISEVWAIPRDQHAVDEFWAD